jgi:aminoglycoside phosphotransferase (APT) family kinase protein
MIDLDYGVLEELEKRLVPLLRRRNIKVESIQLIGLLGRGINSSVFSLLINHQYHVIKLYHDHASFLREMRNHKRLIWPPKILMVSRNNQNSLGYDFVITEVPKGSSLTSDQMLDWVQERLGQHLVELHRLRRKRRISTSSLRRAIDDVEYGSIQAAESSSHTSVQVVQQVILELHRFLQEKSAIMRVEPSLLHNDLWWDNIIVALDDVYLIDWEWLRAGDYLEDLAYFRVMLEFRPLSNQSRKFWQTDPDEAAADRFLAGILEMHQREFKDDTAPERLRFYLALQTLRRLSDYAAGIYGDKPALLDYWLEHLPRFWRLNLEASLAQAE